MHLREDRRHIKDRDVRILREMISVPMNFEMAVYEEITDFAIRILTAQATLVPEKREEVTTEGGLDVRANRARVEACINRLHDAGIRVSLFIDPDVTQVELAAQMGVAAVELHTCGYADATTTAEQDDELDRLVEAGQFAIAQGLQLNMGHGLTYRNVRRIAEIHGVHELNIGHSIVSHAVMVGLERAVREMKQLVSI